MDELEELRATLAVNLRQPGASLGDPQIAPLLARMQALLRQRIADAGGAVAVLHPAARPTKPDHEPRPAPVAAIELPPPLRQLTLDYVAQTRSSRQGPLAGAWFVQAPALSASAAGRKLLELGPADKARVAVATYVAWTNERFGGPDGGALRRIVSDLLRAKLDFDETQALALVRAATREGFGYSSYSPNLAVAGALKRHIETQGLGSSLRDALSGLRARMVQGDSRTNSQGRKLLLAVDAMLAHTTDTANAEPQFTPKQDAWGGAIAAKLAGLPPDRRARLTRLLALAAQGGANAKPAKGWLKIVERELASSDRDRDGALLLELIECHEPGGSLALENQNTLRALLWLAAIAAPVPAARRLEAYAQKCLTFSAAHFAYLSLVLGNAAIHSFSLMPGTAGVGSLSRLKRAMKRPGEIKTIEKALTALAQARGMSAGELEEIGLPDFGFAADGTMQVVVGPATAALAITPAHELETTWRGADGQKLGGPPAAVKNEHPDALKAFKARAKEINETLRAQRLRLERLYLGNREWPLDVWQSRYLEAPLVANLARRLVWAFRLGDRWVAGLPGEGAISDASGARLAVDRAARVRLWHPMQAEASAVLAWRRRLAALGVTQPFKQAHREIYLLTDAERVTRDHSNRFAHHIVDQHLFRALCQARGWSCPAFGGWDPGNARPHKRLAEHDLQVELWVEPVESSMADNFRFQHLATDQVRFTGAGGSPMALDAIDPVLFSELMRDADLFVGVASIGNDPNGADRGDAQLGAYWGRAAFGELSESGKTRHAALADILPGLAIAPRCRLEERYLVVEGRLRGYRIHLGSGNVQMEPNSQYLCIVQDRQRSSGHVRLPFEGDTTLSIILSKAFLLAEDDKITDASIRSQIRQGLPAG